MRIMDGHCHVGVGFEKRLLPEKLLEIMDENGVEKAVICPLEQYIAVENEEGNAYILEQVKKYPDRFIGFASVNPWYLKRGEEHLKRMFDKGLAGLKLNPKLQGFILYSDIVKGLLAVCEEYGKPVYAHTGTMVCAEPFQLTELAREFPEVNFIMGHSGNTDYWNDLPYAVQGVSNVYLETSHNLGIQGLIDIAGIDRVIFGSNMPRSHQSHELKKIMDLPLDIKSKSMLCWDNMIRAIGG